MVLQTLAKDHRKTGLQAMKLVAKLMGQLVTVRVSQTDTVAAPVPLLVSAV
jgi:hypothetical protein